MHRHAFFAENWKPLVLLSLISLLAAIVRFGWPLYPALILVTAYGFSQIVDKVKLYYSRNTNKSFQPGTSAT